MRPLTVESSPGNGIRFNRFLPYWAVLQTDIRQTLRSWVYRLWVLMTLLAGGGYLLYAVGLHQEAGMTQTASLHSQNLLRGLLVATLGLVALLSVSSISAERLSVADAVLSRGISRHQYFLAKWHARSWVMIGTFLLLASLLLGLHYFFLDPDLTLRGAAVAVLIAAALLAVVIAWGVTIGALANSTIMAITIFWMVLYGGIVISSLLPTGYPTPETILKRLPTILQGQYNPDTATQLWIGCGILTLLGALLGLVGFSRKDV